VETSSLIPWIALTAFLHALHAHSHRRDFKYLAPLLAGLSLFLVFFATFVTRSGVWVSVHAYAGASAESAIDRVSEVLAESASIWWLYYGMWGVLLATLIGTGFRFWKAVDEPLGLPDRGDEEPIWEYLARPRVSMFVTVFLLSTSMVLTLLMLLVGANSFVDPDMYNSRIAIFAVPLMAILVICMSVRYLTRKRATIFAGAALVAGIVMWAVNPGDLDPSIAWFGAMIGISGVLQVREGLLPEVGTPHRLQHGAPGSGHGVLCVLPVQRPHPSGIYGGNGIRRYTSGTRGAYSPNHRPGVDH
jgi:hypothetical protein